MICSMCGKALVPHCGDEHPTCTWVRCRTCNTTLDLVRRVGYDKAGRRFRIAEHTETED